MSPAGLLPSSLQSSLHDVMERVYGIRVILLSTNDGVPLGRTLAEDYLHDDVLGSLESTWAPPSKMFQLLNMGKVQSITASYNHGTLVHVYQSPVVVTIVVRPNANMGAIRSTAIPLLKELLDPLRKLLKILQEDGDEGITQGYYE